MPSQRFRRPEAGPVGDEIDRESRAFQHALRQGQPLSDDRIVDLLKGEGIEIARRTVAKYREAMRIPSSVQRRREKLAAAP